MSRDCWQINENGFLIHPKPLASLSGYVADDVATHLDGLIDQLPELLELKQVISEVNRLPLYDISGIEDSLAVERAFQIYGFFTIAYLLEIDSATSKILPKQIAIPFAKLSEIVERPPILSYAPLSLGNYVVLDPSQGIVVDNMDMMFKFMRLKDATWFTLIHVDIEARAGGAVNAIPRIAEAIACDDDATVMRCLDTIHSGLDAMMTTLKRMPEHCHPTVYYHEVRKVMFGFDEVIFEGVERFAGQPQSFVGETGAQSSIIPSLVRLMGIEHEESSMTKYLRVMRDYMPKTHREFILAINPNQLRQFVIERQNAPLSEAYNHTLQQLLTFRKMHIRYAASYIANQSPDSVGTGGTMFMTWLQQLIDETEAQLLA